MLVRIAFPTVLAAAALIAYANSFSGVFLFDDVIRIVEEERIRSLTPLGALLSGERPVVDLTLALNYAIGGLSPFGYHVFNLAVHVFAGWTLFGVVRRSFLNAAKTQLLPTPLNPPLSRGEAPSIIAFAVALIFLIHPLQTQSVTYIIQRGESLMGLFYLLTLYGAIRAIDSPRGWVWGLLAVVACALGMATKGVMVTAPLMVMVYDWVFLARRDDANSWFAAARRRIPLYVGLCATWGLLWWVGIAGEVLGQNAATSHVGFSYHGHSAWEYAATQAGVIVQYLRLSLWPAGQVLDYDWPVAREFVRIALPGLVVLILLGVTVWLLKQRHWLGFVGAWFFIILAPTSSIVPIKDIMFEHRMYLPLAAVIAAIIVPIGAWLIAGAQSSESKAPSMATSSRGLIGFTAIIVLFAAPLAYATHLRNRVYHSELAMWQDVVAKRPHNARGYVGLGVEWIKADKPAEAVRTLRKALELKDLYADAHFNLGVALLRSGQTAEAAGEFVRTFELNPARTDALIHAAQAYGVVGSHDLAVQAMRQAVKVDPGKATHHYHLGNALSDAGKKAEALAAFEEALRLDPANVEARINLGNLLLAQGRLSDAQSRFQEALARQPDQTTARVNLGRVLVHQERWTEALAEFRKVPTGDPLEAEARFGAGLSLAQMSRREEAMNELREALRIKPDHAGAAAEVARLAAQAP